MRVKIQYYASIRELVGTPSEEVSLEEGTRIIDLLKEVIEAHKPLRGLKRILIAVNGEYVEMDKVLRDGDLVAIFPPVSGG